MSNVQFRTGTPIRDGVAAEYKTWREPFAMVVHGWKTFEVRLEDEKAERATPESKVLLREWDEEAVKYTGREIVASVGYKLSLPDMPTWAHHYNWWPQELVDQYGLVVLSLVDVCVYVSVSESLQRLIETRESWARCRCDCLSCRALGAELSQVCFVPQRPLERIWELFRVWLNECLCGCGYCGDVAKAIRKLCSKEADPPRRIQLEPGDIPF